MKRSVNETISSKKWLLIILIHAFGYTVIYGFTAGPLMFPYNMSRSFLQNMTVFLTCYMLVQYVLLQLLVGGKLCGRRCHLRMCALDAGISGLIVVLTLILPVESNYLWIKNFGFMANGIGLSFVLLSTAIAFLRTRRLRAAQSCSATESKKSMLNLQHAAHTPFEFVNGEFSGDDSAQ